MYILYITYMAFIYMKDMVSKYRYGIIYPEYITYIYLFIYIYIYIYIYIIYIYI